MCFCELGGFSCRSLAAFSRFTDRFFLIPVVFCWTLEPDVGLSCLSRCIPERFLFISLWSTTAETKNGLLDANKAPASGFCFYGLKNSKMESFFGLCAPVGRFSLFLDHFTGFRQTLRLLVSIRIKKEMWSAFRSHIRRSFLFGEGEDPRSDTRRSWFCFCLKTTRLTFQLLGHPLQTSAWPTGLRRDAFKTPGRNVLSIEVHWC